MVLMKSMSVLYLVMIFLLLDYVPLHSQIVVAKKPDIPESSIEKPKKPGAEYFWINGHWQWDVSKKNYVWRDGYWEKRKKGYRYEEGHWRTLPEGWLWIPGRWVKKGREPKNVLVKTLATVNSLVPEQDHPVIEPEPGVVPQQPAPPEKEVKKPERPGRDYFWIDGDWKWNAQTASYVRELGHWEQKRAGLRYVPGCWEKVIAGWKWIPGKWVKKE